MQHNRISIQRRRVNNARNADRCITGKIGRAPKRPYVKPGRVRRIGGSRYVADAQSSRFEAWIERSRNVQSWREDKRAQLSKDWPSQPAICGGDDGLLDRLDDITIPKWRRESLKAYGNAIVPQVAYRIFKVINQIG